MGNLPYDATQEELDTLITGAGAGPVVTLGGPATINGPATVETNSPQVAFDASNSTSPNSGDLSYAWAAAPGNTLLPAKATGLPKDAVANASQVISIDRGFLSSRVAKLTPKRLEQVLASIDVVLGR